MGFCWVTAHVAAFLQCSSDFRNRHQSYGGGFQYSVLLGCVWKQCVEGCRRSEDGYWGVYVSGKFILEIYLCEWGAQRTRGIIHGGLEYVGDFVIQYSSLMRRCCNLVSQDLSLVSRVNTFFEVSATATKGLLSWDISQSAANRATPESLQHEHSSILKRVVRLYHTPNKNLRVRVSS
jgi:hypothetical protein